MAQPVYTVNGIKFRDLDQVCTRRIRMRVKDGRYEKAEAEALDAVLLKDDRVLELGSGLGIIAARSATVVGAENVVTIEANPGLANTIRSTLTLNNVAEVRSLSGVGTADPEVTSCRFYVSEHFWGSSLSPQTHGIKSEVDVPAVYLPDLLAEFRPTVLVCDIEGGEFGLLPKLDLSCLRTVVLEIHPKRASREEYRGLIEHLADHGLLIDLALTKYPDVPIFTS